MYYTNFEKYVNYIKYYNINYYIQLINQLIINF